MGAEDQRLVRLTLVKSSRHVKTCWEALLKDQYALDAITLQNMQKKMALEKYQRQVCIHYYRRYLNFFE